MKKVAWIGAGVMGRPMAGHLQAHGFDVSVYARKPEVLETMKTQYGIEKCYSTIKEAVADAEVVFVMVGYPKDVEEVFLSDDGIFANVKPGTYVVDMTTSSPSLAVRLYELGKEKGLHVMDAPVSGGDSGAKAGTLSIMVGGDREAFDACQDVFAAMGTNIIYEGGAGKGQHTKMANQIALAGAVASVSEAIAYARRTGLDVETMLASISKGAAGSWQMTNNAPKMVAGDMAPGFFIKHFIKDMAIADEEAKAAGLTMPVLEEVLEMYRELDRRGEGDLGTQAVIHYFGEK